VGLGTSLPELVVSIQAAVTGYSGLALGNVIGSNIANVLLVGGVAAVVFPLRTTEASTRRSATVMILVALGFVAMCLSGSDITRLEGFLLVGVLLLGTAVTARVALRARTAVMQTPIEWVLGLPTQMGTIALFIGLGLVGLPLGANLLVDAATEIGARLGVSDTVIGLTVVAVGTSLPEVATAVVAGLRRKTVMVVGTLVGSNIFNILAIMGAASIASPEPIQVSGRSLAIDLPVMVVASSTLLAFTWLRRPIRRTTGVVFVLAYLAYAVVLYTTR
jgi:cation:H+ antiporter